MGVYRYVDVVDRDVFCIARLLSGALLYLVICNCCGSLRFRLGCLSFASCSVFNGNTTCQPAKIRAFDVFGRECMCWGVGAVGRYELYVAKKYGNWALPCTAVRRPCVRRRCEHGACVQFLTKDVDESGYSPDTRDGFVVQYRETKVRTTPWMRIVVMRIVNDVTNVFSHLPMASFVATCFWRMCMVKKNIRVVRRLMGVLLVSFFLSISPSLFISRVCLRFFSSRGLSLHAHGLCPYLCVRLLAP